MNQHDNYGFFVPDFPQILAMNVSCSKTSASTQQHREDSILFLGLFVIKHHTQKKHEEERVYFSLKLIGHPGEKSDRNINQKPGGRNRGGMLFPALILMVCSVFLLLIHQYRSRTAHSELGPPTSIQEMHHRLSWRTIWWEQFLNWGSFFQNDSHLCQVNIQLHEDSRFL